MDLFGNDRELFSGDECVGSSSESDGSPRSRIQSNRHKEQQQRDRRPRFVIEDSSSDDEQPTPKQKRARFETPPSRNLSMTGTPRGKSPAQAYNQRLHLMAIEKKVDKCMEQQAEILQKLDALLEQKAQQKPKPQKVVVTKEVRSAVHDGYVNSADVNKWTFTHPDLGHLLKYDCDVNRPMTEHICQYVIGIYPTTAMGVILAAVQTYFLSTRQKEIRKKEGKEDLHRNRQVRYERRKRKVVKRSRAADSKTSWDKEKKMKVKAALRVDLMSSDSECNSEVEGEEGPYFVTRPILWRSDELNKAIQDLDAKMHQQMSGKGKRQLTRRVKGSIFSTRAKPSLPDDLQWVFK